MKAGGQAKTVAMASLVGSFIEWYDFYIFGIASALVFGTLFFPTFSPLAGTLLSFATFATAWVARPVGGVIFGHFGDRIGRKKVLLITLLMMGASTVAVGLVPSYASIGIWAPILLVTARVFQGLSAGGEWAGAAIMSIEHAPTNEKGRFGSYPQLGIPLALIVSNGISLLFYQRADDALMSWGWRIPFLASLIIVPVGLYIRLKVFEAPEFANPDPEHKILKLPIAKVLTDYWRPVLSIIFIMGGTNAFFFTFTTYSLLYATQSGGFSRTTALTAVIVASCVHVVGTMVFGRMSDRVGRRRMYIYGLLFLALVPFPLFAIIDLHSTPLYVLALAVGFGIGHSCVWSLGAAYFTELFPANVRYSGSSLGYQLSGLIFGGPLPIAAAYLVSINGGRPWLLAGFLSLIAVVAAYTAFVSPDERKLTHS
jgi:MHS family shikimate/dehydroshikimate transporter-like MFS transporter